MDAIAPRETVLASNTSGLHITTLGERMAHQDRIGGSHFVQPGHIVPVLLVTGVADAESIDLAVQLGLCPRFITAGPLKKRDINGLKMHVSVAGHLWKELGGWEEPLAYLQAMVERGETGLDAGKGYYDWTGQDPTAVRSEKDEELIKRTEQVMADWHAKNKS